MKPALCYLPLEVWVDILIYPWIGRNMGKLAKLLGCQQFADSPWAKRNLMGQLVWQIGSWEFAEILHFLLYDWRKQTLRAFGFHHGLEFSSKFRHRMLSRLPRKLSKSKLLAILSRRKIHYHSQLRFAELPSNSSDDYDGYHDYDYDTPYHFWYNRDQYEQVPSTVVPDTVKSFRRITINHFDDQVLNFMHLIKPLLANVQLSLPYRFHENVPIVLAYLLPLIESIQMVLVDDESFAAMEEHFPRELLSAKCIWFTCRTDVQFAMKWLITLRHDDETVNQPKLCVCITKTIEQIFGAVKEQFLTATSPATFAIYNRVENPPASNAELHFENDLTDELLTARLLSMECPEAENRSRTTIHYVEICRHKRGEGATLREWLVKNGFHQFDKLLDPTAQCMNPNCDRMIELYRPSIGKLKDRLLFSGHNLAKTQLILVIQ